MARERDSQRSKVYAAIDATERELRLDDMSLVEIQNLLERARDRAPIRARYGEVRFELTDGRGWGRCASDGRKIHAPRCERNAVRILCAYAHIVLRTNGGNRRSQDDLWNTRTMAWHGWGYCSVLVDLMHFGLGRDQAGVLQKHFTAHGVRFRKPFKKELSLEQRQNNQVRGQALAEKMKRRRLLERFVKDQPNAILKDQDSFEDEQWETLFALWCP